MKYFLYTRDMISTSFYTSSGYNALLEAEPHALDEWIEITADLYEQGMDIDYNGQKPLYCYNETGTQIVSCKAISNEEAQEIMKAADEKKTAELSQPKEEILVDDINSDSGTTYDAEVETNTTTDAAN